MATAIGGDSAPDLAEAARFLALLDETAEAFTFQTFDDDKARQDSKLARIFHGSLEQHAELLARAQQNGAGVFVMVQQGDGKGRKNINVAGIRAVFVENDSGEVPPFPAGMEPHIVVESSPGRRHLYFLVHGLSCPEFADVQARMVADYGSDPNAKDLARVLRVPGFWHLKNRAAPFRVRIVSESGGLPYPRETILKAFPPLADKRRPAPGKTKDGVIVEGGRNAYLTRLAGTMRRQGMSEDAMRAALLAENRVRCSPPLPDKEVEQIARSVARYKPAPSKDSTNDMVRSGPAAGGEEWPDPVLPGAACGPEIPASLLPTWVGAMAAAVAKWTQTPESMSVLLALSVLATVLQRRFEVGRQGDSDDYSESLSLWILVAIGSANRKTAVLDAMKAPLVHWEKLQRDRMRPEIARNKSARDVAEARIVRLKANAAKAKTPEDREVIREEIQQELENMPAELLAPRLFTTEATPERTQQMLVDYDERMAVLGDEAGIFNVMGGAHSAGSANFDVFLQGHAGSSFRVDRASRKAHVDRPAVSFGLAIQDGILADVGRNKRFRDSGLLARCWKTKLAARRAKSGTFSMPPRRPRAGRVPGGRRLYLRP